MVLQILDVATTWYGIPRGGIEMNLVYNYFGMGAFILSKLIMIPLVLILIEFGLKCYESALSQTILYGGFFVVNAFYVITVVNNFIILGGL